jgi:hypothetical protein
MKLDRRQFLGSSVGLAATVGITAEWVWPNHSVSYRRPRSAVAVLNADEYSEKVEALLLDGLRLFRLKVLGRSILLKPNLVEDLPGPVNTSATLVGAAARSFRRCCHIYAVYTRKRDVTRRLANILAREGIRVAVLTSDVPPEKREAWFSQRLREGVQVTISHPRIIETGLDLLSHPSLIFYESGYSLYTLRQASRRSWRIGQRQPVRVFYLHYVDTMQSACLRLMGKKLLVSLAMEGKFCREGLQSLEEDDDMLTAMARELVTERGIGESANEVWRQIQAEQTRPLPVPTASIEEAATVGEPPLVAPFSIPVNVDAPKFGARPLSERPIRRKEPSLTDLQFSLF